MFSAPKLPSPVPTYTVVQTLAPHVVGSTASEPTAIVGSPLLAGLSVSGVHVVPRSVVTQMPPSAPPRYTLFALLGFITKAVTRPEVAPPFCEKSKSVVAVGWGPIGNHAEVGPRGGV